MSGPPAYIHLKEGSIPKSRYNPIAVPYHFKGQVSQVLCVVIHIYPTPPLGQDMTQGQFLSRV